MTCTLVIVDPDIQSGAPVFAGQQHLTPPTSVPAQAPSRSSAPD